jgi:hypothetical protein
LYLSFYKNRDGDGNQYVQAFIGTRGVWGSNNTDLRFYVNNSVGANLLPTSPQMVINGANGNVGIGTTTPGSLFDVTRSDGTAYTASNTLVSGQWMRISNPNTATGIASTLLFETRGGSNGLATISGVERGTGSSALTFGTRLSNSSVTEHMRIESDGIIIHNGVSTYSNAIGSMLNNVEYNFDITVGNEGGNGNVIEVHAMYDHYYNFAYGASLITLVGKRGTSVARSDIKAISTGNGGSWTISAPNATTLRLTKTAGTYPGGGHGHIMVRFRKS